MEYFELLHKLIEHTITYPEAKDLEWGFVLISVSIFIVTLIIPSKHKVVKWLTAVITIVSIIISINAYFTSKELKSEYYDSFQEVIKTNIENVTDKEAIVTKNMIAVPKDVSYEEMKQIIKIIQDAYDNEYYNQMYRRYSLGIVDNLYPKKEEVRDRYGNTIGYETKYEYSSVNHDDLMLINTESIKDNELNEIMHKDKSYTMSEDTEGNILTPIRVKVTIIILLFVIFLMIASML